MSEPEGDDVSVSFDLADYLPEGSLSLGFLGVVKFLDGATGREQVAYLEGGFKHWERLGIAEFAHQRIAQLNQSYYASVYDKLSNELPDDPDPEDD